MMIFLVMNFIIVSFLIGLIFYGLQTNEKRSNDLINLTRAVHDSDIHATHNTDKLVKQTIEASDRNYELLAKRAAVASVIYDKLLNETREIKSIVSNLSNSNLQSVSPANSSK